MATEQSLFDLNDTWEDCLDKYNELRKSESTWSCFCVENVDKEVILSAPEIMDPKTDSGFGYQNIGSLDYLIKTGAIPDASQFNSEEDLLSIMDTIHAKELIYLRGFSLVQSYLSFPYFLKLDLLKSQNSTLYAYCRGVARSLECIVRAVFCTNIRSEEEFMMSPPEFNRLGDVPLEEIVAELEEAACKCNSQAVAARLRWRKHFLSALALFLDPKRRSDVDAACEICKEAADLLASEHFKRQTEPTMNERLFRENEIGYWVSVITPTKPLERPTFSETIATYTLMLRQLHSLQQLLQIKSLQCITEFVENFGAKEPLLLTRCIAVTVLFSSEPNESFLFGAPLDRRILETLANDYGAPLYLRILEGDQTALEAVVKYRVHKSMDPAKVSNDKLNSLRQQTVETLHRWASDASKVYLVHLEIMLCNRGLAHSRLMKNMPQLSGFQEMSYLTDISIFFAHNSSTTTNNNDNNNNNEAAAAKASLVLSMYANQFVLREMELVIQFMMELNLLSQGELLPALWYINFTQRAQVENMMSLCLQSTAFIPENRINKKTNVPLYNLALTTRKVGRVDGIWMTLLNARRMLSHASFLAGCLLEHCGLIDLISPPKHSLISVENAFNQRIMACFSEIRNIPFTPYAKCIAAKTNFTELSTTLSAYAKTTGEIAMKVAETMKSTRQTELIDPTRAESIHTNIDALEKTARALSAVMASFSAVCDNGDVKEKFVVHLHRPFAPHLVNFMLSKKN